MSALLFTFGADSPLLWACIATLEAWLIASCFELLKRLRHKRARALRSLANACWAVGVASLTIGLAAQTLLAR